ncbi:SHOCT domain-containing protein [Mangrovitalea sediminis]|uniref:hypothetical protein n=1 Tax=Mangrovitalea sediminis TaxID=1982043 RepID=UPI000BE57CC0|nr:hypothetical protein [Mangrovitalea sediminis]
MGKRGKETLNDLQQQYFEGEISQDEYRRRRRDWLEALLQGAAAEEPTVVQVHKAPVRRRFTRPFLLVAFLIVVLALGLARVFW